MPQNFSIDKNIKEMKDRSHKRFKQTFYLLTNGFQFLKKFQQLLLKIRNRVRKINEK